MQFYDRLEDVIDMEKLILNFIKWEYEKIKYSPRWFFTKLYLLLSKLFCLEEGHYLCPDYAIM